MLFDYVEECPRKCKHNNYKKIASPVSVPPSLCVDYNSFGDGACVLVIKRMLIKETRCSIPSPWVRHFLLLTDIKTSNEIAHVQIKLAIRVNITVGEHTKQRKVGTFSFENNQ